MILQWKVMGRATSVMGKRITYHEINGLLVSSLLHFRLFNCWVIKKVRRTWAYLRRKWKLAQWWMWLCSERGPHQSEATSRGAVFNYIWQAHSDLSTLMYFVCSAPEDIIELDGRLRLKRGRLWSTLVCSISWYLGLLRIKYISK